MEQPLLSIVVPTKNRYKYLKCLIHYIARTFPQNEIQLVIQDNTENNNEIVDYLYEYNDSNNIKYFHEKRSLSMSENSDLAINHSNGKYVCFIGDDDCVLHDILNFTKYADKYGIESIVTHRLTYVWPDAQKFISYLSTDMQIKRFDSCVINVDTKKEIEKVLKIGGQSMCNMPRVYHGIVLRKTLDKLWDKYQTYFPGPSPDMANAIALSFMNVKTIYVNYPVIIAGTGYTRIKGNEKGDRQEVKETHFLKKDVLINWNSHIPKLWTTPTIYAQTVYYGVCNGNKELLNLFNWEEFFISLGASFFMDYLRIAFKEKCIYLLFPIFFRKIKILAYRNFKYTINRLRGYRFYNFDTATACTYAKSVEEIIDNNNLKYE